MEMSASVDSKPLTRSISPLDATLMKKQGAGLIVGADRAHPRQN